MTRTILFCDAKNQTAGILVVGREEAGDAWAIYRHAHEQGEYVRAYVLTDDGFEPLHYAPNGMLTQRAIDRLDEVRQ